MPIKFDADRLIKMLEVMSLNKTKVEARMLLDLIYDGFFDIRED